MQFLLLFRSRFDKIRISLFSQKEGRPSFCWTNSSNRKRIVRNIAEYTVCIFPCILFPSAKIKHRNNVIYHKIGYDCICEKEDAVIK